MNSLTSDKLSMELKARLTRGTARAASAEGFVIPAVIFSLVLMSTLAVAALLTADDERRSSRAVRESNAAFYAAEAGLNEVWATWDDTLVQNLNPGDSLDLGWQTLPNGSSYRAVIQRYDNGGQAIYALVAEGRGRGPLGGQKMLSFSLSKTRAASFCCSGAVRGTAEFEIDKATVSGFDSIPAAWGGICSNTPEDLPGMEWNGVVDTSLATVEGNPALVEDATIDTTNLFNWGDLDYDSLVALADITLNGTVGRIGPNTSGGDCVTTDLLNWGDPLNPSSPCFDYFPIIHADQLEIQNGSVGQGILLVDKELEIEPAATFTFYGIVISKTQTQFEDAVKIYGGLIINGEFEAETGPTIQYSQCAVNRAITAHQELTRVEQLSSRYWGEVMR